MISEDYYSGRIRVRSCGLLIRDHRILLVEQKVPTRDHLVWLPPGGGVKVGEPAEEALIREFKEETHLEISALKLRYVHEFIQPPIHALELYYNIGSSKGEIQNGTDPEHTADNQLIHNVKFVHFNRLNSIDLLPGFLTKELNNGNLFDDRITYFETHEF